MKRASPFFETILPSGGARPTTESMKKSPSVSKPKALPADENASADTAVHSTDISCLRELGKGGWLESENRV